MSFLNIMDEILNETTSAIDLLNEEVRELSRLALHEKMARLLVSFRRRVLPIYRKLMLYMDIRL